MKTKKILLIDDTKDFRNLIGQALKLRPSAELVACDSAESALAYLATAEELPCLVFVDLRMPGMPGEDFIKNVRNSSRLKSLKIIITSGWSNLKTISSAIGANGYLRKPFELKDFFSIVDQELSGVGDQVESHLS